MTPSPRRRRRKPRHARPRPARWGRRCPLCVVDALEAAVGPAGQLFLAHQSEHWLAAAGACLVLLRMAGQRCPHTPGARCRLTPGTERPDDSGAREAHDAH
ncbi:hypothetical protein EV284_3943 [Streptomyces sp. BK022]|uniref:hypothetical protein n=1 Tax=Streptomyces sp. BK022 TaxID=2512123 RepID=UPI00102A239C|nr:hypothetical protein [Streptomyces sp. BK022]RZU36450.1 hypothetical protein EV284_3943 [Streptomyces sp. BK022]